MKNLISLTNYELANLNGGGLSATLINALTRAASFIYNVGYALGSTVRRLFSGKVCK